MALANCLLYSEIIVFSDAKTINKQQTNQHEKIYISCHFDSSYRFVNAGRRRRFSCVYD